MSKKVYNVLVFPGGTEIGMEIQKALIRCKDIKLFSAGLDTSNHAPYLFSRHFIIPSIHDAPWIDKLNQVIIENGIDYVFPAYDDIIVAMAQNSSAIKARIVSSPLETCLITRSKSHVCSHMSDIIPVPKMYDNVDAIEEYPVFVKPDRGQGSKNVHIVYNKEQLSVLLQDGHEFIVLEYLPGDEYTVDCFSDRESGLLFCGARERIRTRCGISMSSRSAYNDVFFDYAVKITKKMTFHGAWFFQVKQDRTGAFKLLEVAPRIAGTMALHRVQGVNFPLLSIYEQERIPVTIMQNSVTVDIDRALVNRYKHNISYKVVYVDLDDTLIMNDSVNLELIRFMYQCINKGVRIVLLTKHEKNVDATLKKYRLKEVFDDIIHIGKSASKSDFIKEKDAVFIDDSFSERKEVFDRLGIPTFDCSMLEVLLDDRG